MIQKMAIHRNDHRSPCKFNQTTYASGSIFFFFTFSKIAQKLKGIEKDRLVS